MNFDFTEALNVKTPSGKKLNAGIAKAKFVSIKKEVQALQNGDEANVLAVTFDIEDYGEYTVKVFETEDKERKDTSWGTKNPSPVDDFNIFIVQLLNALKPQFKEDIAAGKLKLGGSIAQIGKALNAYLADAVGTEIEIKLLPNQKGYANIPTRFIARIDKDGRLAIGNLIFGKNLTLTASEQKKIDAAKTAAPTPMKSATQKSSLAAALLADEEDMPADIAGKTNEDEDDSLPF